MCEKIPKVLIIATSRKTRGGITSVIKAHQTGEQWKKVKCKWIETHRDGNIITKLFYLLNSLLTYYILLPFYDIVHIHIATGNSAKRKQLYIYPAKWLHKKIILHFHPSNEKFLFEQKNQILYKRLFSKADLILVLSGQWKKWLLETLDLQNEIEVLYNPCPSVVRNEKNRKNHILFAGTIIERKGYETLIKAFSLIAKEFPDWSVIFAGNGEISKANQLVSELKISEQVKFLGWVSNIEKEKTFQETSIYCLASDGEGFPMSLLDAWAYGIPCIVTPVGGIPDIVKNGVNGMIFPVGNYTQLAEYLKKLILDEDLRKRIVQKSDEYVNGEFALTNINNKISNIYNNLFYVKNSH